MTTLLIIASSILTVGSVLPYIMDIIRGKTKPRVVSWFTWTLLTGVAFAAAFADKEYPTAILLFFASLATLLVVILGWKHGDRKFERLDLLCQLGVVLGLVLWFIFDSPWVAVLAVVAIDLVGAIPTLIHSWVKPH